MSKIKYMHQLEEKVGNALSENNIEFVHDSQNQDQRLDFYLTKYDLYIEVKWKYREKVALQLATQRNIILLQGAKAVDLFCQLLSK